MKSLRIGILIALFVFVTDREALWASSPRFERMLRAFEARLSGQNVLDENKGSPKPAAPFTQAITHKGFMSRLMTDFHLGSRASYQLGSHMDQHPQNTFNEADSLRNENEEFINLRSAVE